MPVVVSRRAIRTRRNDGRGDTHQAKTSGYRTEETREGGNAGTRDLRRALRSLGAERGNAERRGGDGACTVLGNNGAAGAGRSGPGRHRPQHPGRPPPPVHLKVDTGMTRLGVFPEDVPVLLDRLTAKGIPVEGCYTQLACADEPDHVMTQEQLVRFRPAREAIRARVPRALIHVANSAGALTSPHTHFDMVRVGLAMYGLYPSPQMASLGSLHPAMRLYSRVVRTARVGPGTAVSYGAAHRTKTSTTIATIACGYADGYPRLAGERGEVLIRGQRHRIAGRVCMDHLMVDVGDHPVAAGHVAQLFGDAISAGEVAAWALTISYGDLF